MSRTEPYDPSVGFTTDERIEEALIGALAELDRAGQLVPQPDGDPALLIALGAARAQLFQARQIMVMRIQQHALSSSCSA